MTKDLQTGVIYARYSSDKQRDESIEGQIRECTEYAQREGILITKIYTDRALSARTDNRPEFLQMIRDSAHQSFNYVIVYQLDRFSRSREDSAKYKGILRRNGVRVLSAKEHITAEPAGIILESMLEGMAEYYSVELSQKVKRGMTENALKGKMNGSAVPLGYDLTESHHLAVNAHEAKAVRLIYDLYLKQHSIAKISDILHSKGYLTKRGRKISPSVIKTILSNEKYIGVYSWGDIRIENSIPPIISKSVFDEVQAIMPTRIKNKGRRSEMYNLCGKLICGECGGHYAGSTATSRNKEKHHYYVCTNRRKYHTCTAPNIRRDELEDLVINRTLEILNQPSNIARIVDLVMSGYNNTTQEAKTAIQGINNKIKAIDTELNNCMNAIKQGFITERLKGEIENLESERNNLLEQKANHESALIPIKFTADHIEYFLERMAKENPTTKAGRSRILDTFIKSVTIYSDRVEIVFNYKNELPAFNTQCATGSHFKVLVGNMCNKANHFYINSTAYPITLIVPFNS